VQIIHKTLPTDHNLYLISDTHEGTLLQHEHGIERMIQAVLEDKNNYVAILGDLAEGITIDDKRYDPATTDDRVPTPLQQYRSLVEMFKPIKERIVVVLEGNHDYKISARFGNGVRDIFCSGLNVPFGTYSCKLAVNDRKGKLQYKAHLTHGYGNVNSTADDPLRQEANMLLSLKRKLHKKAGDCAFHAMGHTHKLLVKSPISKLYLADNGEKIKQHYTKADYTAEYIDPDLRWYVNTGSFYRNFHMGESGYAERFGYDPTELGYAVVEVMNSDIKEIRKVILD
jgi:predicted phosphodiesterase